MSSSPHSPRQLTLTLQSDHTTSQTTNRTSTTDQPFNYQHHRPNSNAAAKRMKQKQAASRGGNNTDLNSPTRRNDSSTGEPDLFSPIATHPHLTTTTAAAAGGSRSDFTFTVSPNTGVTNTTTPNTIPTATSTTTNPSATTIISDPAQLLLVDPSLNSEHLNEEKVMNELSTAMHREETNSPRARQQQQTQLAQQQLLQQQQQLQSKPSPRSYRTGPALPQLPIPESVLNSLVRSHVRHVGLSARLKTKLHVREMRDALKDAKVRAVLKTRPRALPTRTSQQQEEKSQSSPVRPEQRRPSHSTSPTRTPRLTQSIRSPTRLAPLLSDAPPTAAAVTSTVATFSETSAPIPIVPWPSWQPEPKSASHTAGGGGGGGGHSDSDDDGEEVVVDAPMWRDQFGNAIGVESIGNVPTVVKKKSIHPIELVDQNSLRMPPIKSEMVQGRMRSNGLKGSFVPRL